MQDDYKPIILNIPDRQSASIFFVHDLHKGNCLHDDKKWESVKRLILSKENNYVIFIGDMMENVIPESKGDIFYQTMDPQMQKIWFAQQLKDLEGHVISVCDGNHERNRTTKVCGMFPLYDACLFAGIGELYRPHFCVIDIGIGKRKDSGCGRSVHYVGFVTHKATDQVKFCSADALEGFDFFAYGHDHNPKDKPRGKLVYDSHNKTLREKDIEVINNGSFLKYGGYAVDGGYRPSAQKLYRMDIGGEEKTIETHGFHL